MNEPSTVSPVTAVGVLKPGEQYFYEEAHGTGRGAWVQLLIGGPSRLGTVYVEVLERVGDPINAHLIAGQEVYMRARELQAEPGKPFGDIGPVGPMRIQHLKLLTDAMAMEGNGHVADAMERLWSTLPSVCGNDPVANTRMDALEYLVDSLCELLQEHVHKVQTLHRNIQRLCPSELADQIVQD